MLPYHDDQLKCAGQFIHRVFFDFIFALDDTECFMRNANSRLSLEYLSTIFAVTLCSFSIFLFLFDAFPLTSFTYKHIHCLSFLVFSGKYTYCYFFLTGCVGCAKLTVVLAAGKSRTSKYLYGLAHGLPPLSFEWVFECDKQQRLVYPWLYILPSGTSVDGQDVSYPHRNLKTRFGFLPLARSKRALANITIINVGGTEYLKEWNRLLYASGAKIFCFCQALNNSTFVDKSRGSSIRRGKNVVSSQSLSHCSWCDLVTSRLALEDSSEKAAQTERTLTRRSRFDIHYRLPILLYFFFLSFSFSFSLSVCLSLSVSVRMLLVFLSVSLLSLCLLLFRAFYS